MKLPKSVLVLTFAKTKASDEAKLSLAVGGACCLLGALGWFVNYLNPGTTTLGALVIIGGFYLLAGTASLIKSYRESSDSTSSAHTDLVTEPVVTRDQAA